MTEPSSQQAVVVTGASSGIGRATALRLAHHGYRVYAGFRRPDSGGTLGAESTNLTPVYVDVTEPDSIEALRERLDRELGDIGLRGVVNNAGTTTAAPVEHLSLDNFRRVLEVNVVGQVAVTQALLPLLRTGGGRVVNISSMGGRIAGPIMGPYAASKFALEAITDALRREVRSQGIEVVAIEPGAVATPIWNKIDAKVDDTDFPPEARRVYGDLINGVREGIFKASSTHGVPPERIADVVEHVLTRQRPRTRYLVGRSARARVFASKVLPSRLFDTVISGAIRRLGARSAPNRETAEHSS